MNRWGRIKRIFIVDAIFAALLLPLVAAAATPSASPAPFDACAAVGVRAAADLLGSAIVNNAANYHDTESTPRQSSLCVYNAVNHAQLSVLLLRFGSTAKDRESLAAFRSSYERAASGQYGSPVTTTEGDETVVTFQSDRYRLLDVAAFAKNSAARITLTFGKAEPSTLDALVLSLARATYGAAPATPTPSPLMAPCGRRASRVRYRG